MRRHWPLISAVLPGVGRGVSETGSSFCVGQRAEGGILWLLFGAFLLLSGGPFALAGENGHWAVILWSLDTFLIFPYFLRSYVLSRAARRQATPIYHVYK